MSTRCPVRLSSAPQPAFARVTAWGTYGSGNGQFINPSGIAIHPDGSVYVGDQGNNRVQKFTAQGGYLMKWGSTGSGDGQFGSIMSIAVSSDGSVYVVDDQYGRVQKFTAGGSFVLKWGSTGSGDGQFSYPKGIATSPDGSQVYVTDMDNARIQRFDSSGGYLGKWGTEGDGDGQFHWPQGLTVDDTGHVYVADTYNCRIQKFDATGTFLGKWTPPRTGDCTDGAGAPWSIAVGRDVVVGEQSPYSRLERFSRTGTLLARFGGPGRAVGQFFGGPNAIAMMSDVVYVADDMHRVQRVDTRTPSAALDVTPEIASTGEPVTLNASGSGVPLGRIVNYRWDSDGDGSFDTETASPALTRTFPDRLAANVRVAVTTEDGQTAVATAPVDVRSAPPEGPLGVSINDGQIATNERSVDVTMIWPWHVISAILANDGGFRPSRTLPVAATVPWTLSSSGAERTPKTVYVRFDGGDAGRETYTDDIVLDDTRPSVAATMGAGGTAAAAASKKRRRIKVTCKDNASGIALIQVSSRKRGGTLLRLVRGNRLGKRRLNRTIRVRTGTRAYIRVRDVAGNYSRWRAVRVRKRR
jgi:DNA-binding beta-propeller fold protein YncE